MSDRGPMASALCSVGNNSGWSITALLTALLFSVTSNLINYFSLVATPLLRMWSGALLRAAIRPALGWTVRFFKALSGCEFVLLFETLPPVIGPWCVTIARTPPPPPPPRPPPPVGRRCDRDLSLYGLTAAIYWVQINTKCSKILYIVFSFFNQI